MPYRTTDTDTELFILGEVPSWMIEVYIPDDLALRSLTVDRLTVSPIRRQLDKEHGVAQIADVNIRFKNENNQFNDTSATSVFNGKQVYKDWVRIKSGWGPQWSTDVEVQFQGKIRELLTDNKWEARMVVYDILQDLKDTAVTAAIGDLTISETEVPGMNPMNILEYLMVQFNIRWLNMDTLIEEPILEPVSLAEAKVATEGLSIGTTVWPVGSKLFDMAADLMKMAGGYLFTGKTGQIQSYVFAPSQDADSARGVYSFVGDETTKEPEIIISKRQIGGKDVVNQVAWTYGQNNVEFTSEKDDASVTKYGLKTLKLTTGWEPPADITGAADTFPLAIVSGRTMARFSEPPPTYDATMSWLMNGDGLELDLGDIVDLTDPALNIANEYVETHRLQTNLETQATQATLFDTTALQGKFWWFSSEIDEGDGLGITGGDFATNWLNRFLFFSHNDDDNHPAFDSEGNNNGVIDPSVTPLDAWGNGIEEYFIFY